MNEQEQLLEQLVQAHENADFSELKRLAEQAVEQYPNAAWGYFYRAEAAVAYTDYEKAQPDYAQAVELDGNSIDYKGRLVFAALQNEDVDVAEDACLALLEQAPDHPEAHFNAAMFYSATSSFEDALEHLDRALELDPQHRGALRTRADIYFSEGRIAEAIADVDAVLAQDPNDEQTLHSRIQYQSLSAEPDWAAVVADYHTLLKINPIEPTYYNLAGETYMHAANYAEAEKMFDKAIELAVMYSMGDPIYFKNRGMARVYQSNFLGGMEDFRSVTDMDEADPEGYLYMAEARLRAGDVNGAVGYLELGLDLVTAEDKWKLQRKMGNIFLEQGNYDRAEGIFKQILKNEGTEAKAEGCYAMGNLYHRQGNLRAAYKAWDKATQLMYHPKAEELIQTHCQELVEADMQAAENSLIEQYRPEFERNRKSPVLNAFFGKLWKVDEPLTNQKNKILNEIPDDIRPLIMEAFANMVVLVTEAGFLIFNPGRESVRSLYRVVGETSNAVKIAGQPITQGKPREMTFGLAGGRLILAGLGDPDAKVDLFFQESSVDKISAAHRNELKQLLQDKNTQYLGAIAQELAAKI